MGDRLDRLLWIGPVALLVTACAFGALDARFSTDTWIGLAAGRQLLEQIDWARFQETFPRQDTFSYTFYGQVWLNQNWLTHLGQYWLYDRAGPSAVVYGTWAIVAGVHVLVLLAAYWRTGSWLAACLAAALVGIGGRDFLEPRAATVGLFCVAGTWAMICAIEGQGERRRWWPIVLLVPLLVLWSNAHGGFVFGYGLIGLYVGYWVAMRLSPWKSASGLAASGRQMLAVAAVLVVAIIAAAALGPFGISNLLHPEKVGASTVFRSVTEWQPAYSLVGTAFPPMWRFWCILGLVAGSLCVLWLAARTGRRDGAQSAADRAAPPASLFDFAMVLVCLCMTVLARRFAPLLYVIAAPVVAVWVMRLAAPLAPRLRARARGTLMAAAALGAAVTGSLAWAMAQRDLVEPFRGRPEVGLLERARGAPETHEALRFVRENRLRINLFTTYDDGGAVMFHAPLARVFIDGRAEQLYSEGHVRRYWSMVNTRASRHELRSVFDATKTDAVLVRRAPHTAALRGALQSAPDWTLVLLSEEYVLFLRGSSGALERLGALVRDGKEWRPTRDGTITPEAQASRAMVLLNTAQPDPAQALTLLQGAVDRQPTLGHTFYPAIARLLAETAGPAALNDYLSAQAARLESDAALDARTRAALLSALSEARRRLER